MNNKVDMKSYAKRLNELTFLHYINELTLLCLNLFEWTGLPEGIKAEYIEKRLIENGSCMFFKDGLIDYMITDCTHDGLNYYDEPINLRPVANNYINVKTYTSGVNAVYIKNNALESNFLNKIYLTAYRLTELTRTQDINIKAHKTPVLIICSEKQRLTLKNAYIQWDGNEPVIYGDKNMDWDSIKVLKTDAPIIFDKLEVQKHQVLNEFLTSIGINNANMDKKERLVASETEGNNESVETYKDVYLEAREIACNQINSIYGLNISVKRKNDYKPNSELSEGVNDSEDESEED